MVTDREAMATIIMLSCSTRMRQETALHYADNLIRAGYGKLPGPDPTAVAWLELTASAIELGTAAARFQAARDKYITTKKKETP